MLQQNENVYEFSLMFSAKSYLKRLYSAKSHLMNIVRITNHDKELAYTQWKLVHNTYSFFSLHNSFSEISFVVLHVTHMVADWSGNCFRGRRVLK